MTANHHEAGSSPAPLSIISKLGVWTWTLRLWAKMEWLMWRHDFTAQQKAECWKRLTQVIEEKNIELRRMVEVKNKSNVN
jgi:hypothetical protein